jgi:thioredoxin 2
MGQEARLAVVPCTFCSKLNRVDLGRALDRPRCGSCGRRILLDRPLRLNDVNFQRVVQDATPKLLVDFYADWCAPCKMMAPALDEIAHEYEGDVLIAKLDTEQNPEVATRYGIRTIPTLIVFQNGREMLRQSGALRREQLELLLGLHSGRASA